MGVIGKNAIPIDEVRCPKCGNRTHWNMPSGPGSTTTATCSNGIMATKLMGSPSCSWKGIRIVRRSDQDVYQVPELESLTLSFEARTRLLFELGRYDGYTNRIESGRSRHDEMKNADRTYARGFDQGFEERRARLIDDAEKIAKKTKAPKGKTSVLKGKPSASPTRDHTCTADDCCPAPSRRPHRFIGNGVHKGSS